MPALPGFQARSLVLTQRWVRARLNGSIDKQVLLFVIRRGHNSCARARVACPYEYFGDTNLPIEHNAF